MSHKNAMSYIVYTIIWNYFLATWPQMWSNSREWKNVCQKEGFHIRQTRCHNSFSSVVKQQWYSLVTVAELWSRIQVSIEKNHCDCLTTQFIHSPGANEIWFIRHKHLCCAIFVVKYATPEIFKYAWREILYNHQDKQIHVGLTGSFVHYISNQIEQIWNISFVKVRSLICAWH